MCEECCARLRARKGSADAARRLARPSIECRRHLEVEAPRIDATEFRTAWQIKTHLAALAEAGRIGRAELEAGLAWRRWCETLGWQRTQSWSIRVDRKNAADMTEHELAAAAKLRAAAALGPDRTTLLLLLIVDDCRWGQISALIGVRETGRRRPIVPRRLRRSPRGSPAGRCRNRLAEAGAGRPGNTPGRQQRWALDRRVIARVPPRASAGVRGNFVASADQTLFAASDQGE